MRVLIVDDNEMTVRGIKDYCDDNEWDVMIVDFDQSYQQIMVFDPDVVILDWCREAGDNAANPILDSIWYNGYRPVVIFSGNMDAIQLDEKYQNSTMLVRIPKGDEQPVIDYLCQNLAYISVLAEYRRQMGVALIEAFKAIKPIQDAVQNYIGDEIVKYILAKRTVNYFDIESTEQPLPPWGIYIAPPISPSLTVCDIVRAFSTETNLSEVGDPQEYKMIFTPSCDMVRQGMREPKVSHVMCAECVGKNRFYENIKIATSKIKPDSAKQSQRLHDICGALNRGYNERWIALPEMVGVCPYMTVDLKKTRLIDLNSIAVNSNEIKECTEYVRVASIDSPFREQLVWAYMQNACRPGVPDRNVEEWARKIMS